jgi:hypothetical protein
LSKYYTEEKWIEKKISQGYFGFDVCELNKIYSQEEITKLEKFFQHHGNSIDKESTSDVRKIFAGESLPLKNSKRSTDSFLNWLKEAITTNPKIEGLDIVTEPIREYMNGFDLDTLCNWSDYNLKSENKTVCYSYEFIKLAYFYLNASILDQEQINQIPGISDLGITVEPGTVKIYQNIADCHTEDYKSYKQTVDKISKDVIKHLYDEDLEDYEQMANQLSILPEFSFMSCHSDDTDSDERDFTILIYFNSEWGEDDGGKLRYHIPRISIDKLPEFKQVDSINISNQHSKTNAPLVYHTYSKHHFYDISPIFTNVVIMNHTANDNIGALIQHEVTMNLSDRNRYALYSTYSKK